MEGAPGGPMDGGASGPSDGGAIGPPPSDGRFGGPPIDGSGGLPGLGRPRAGVAGLPRLGGGAPRDGTGGLLELGGGLIVPGPVTIAGRVGFGLASGLLASGDGSLGASGSVISESRVSLTSRSSLPSDMFAGARSARRSTVGSRRASGSGARSVRRSVIGSGASAGLSGVGSAADPARSGAAAGGWEECGNSRTIASSSPRNFCSRFGRDFGSLASAANSGAGIDSGGGRLAAACSSCVPLSPPVNSEAPRRNR